MHDQENKKKSISRGAAFESALPSIQPMKGHTYMYPFQVTKTVTYLALTVKMLTFAVHENPPLPLS